jgi:transcriptional regulator with XRE-family HTH domain
VTGTELRAWRTSRGLYQRDVVRLLAAAGVDGIDQPTVSEWERGVEPIPDEVPALLESSNAPPPTQEPTPPPRPRRGAGSRREPAPEPQPAPVGAPPPADEQPADEPRKDRAPRAVPPPGPVTRGVDSAPWDAAVRSQLEKDLRTLFAGEAFLVPVPVADANGDVAYRHEEAFAPGIAQLVGYADAYDGQVIAMNAPAMARAWAALADESPQVRRFLMFLTYGGAWRGVIAASLPVVYAIGVHHGLIPPVLGGGGAAPPQPVAAGDEYGAPA